VGKETAAVSWPVTVGAPITRNFFPEIWSLDRSSPPLGACKAASTPGLVAEIERAATGTLDGRRWSMRWIGRDALAAQAGAHLLERYRPTLLAVHFTTVDHFQHEEGRSGSLVDRSVATVDAGVSVLVEAAERAGIAERTAFVITGDHGFVDIHSQVSPNVWLAEAGLQAPQRDRGDWKAAFLTSGASALLRLRDPGDRATLRRVRQLLAELPAAIRKTFRVLDRAVLDACGADRDAPLALAANPGYTFSHANEGDAITHAGYGGQHGYFPDVPEIHTGFIGWGAGFRSHAVAPMIGLEDIAPLIAKLLDVEFEAPDGAAPVGLLAPPPRVPRKARLYK
jgi:predicted AlkP superfamily pyrophosphatase or phosphodiesterase